MTNLWRDMFWPQTKQATLNCLDGLVADVLWLANGLECVGEKKINLLLPLPFSTCLDVLIANFSQHSNYLLF